MIYGPDKDFSAERRKGYHLLYESMGVLEDYWLWESDYICGDTVSYADLAAFHELVSHDAGKIIPDKVWKKHPRIGEWFERMSARPASKAVSAWQYETIAKVLKANGYATAGFPATRILAKEFGLDQGFAHWLHHLLSGLLARR